jgi:hypothetical protein
MVDIVALPVGSCYVVFPKYFQFHAVKGDVAHVLIYTTP